MIKTIDYNRGSYNKWLVFLKDEDEKLYTVKVLVSEEDSSITVNVVSPTPIKDVELITDLEGTAICFLEAENQIKYNEEDDTYTIID